MKALIFAAGLGTRLKPWTDHHPKALAEVNGKTLLQRTIEYLQGYGIFDVVVNIHHFPDQIRNEVAENAGWGSRVTFSDESGQVLETGGGLKKAESLLKGDGAFVAMNADILTDLPLDKMIASHKESKALATLATSNRTSTRHLLFNENNELAGWENVNTGEKKIAKGAKEYIPKAFSGVHVISDVMFPLIRKVGKFSIIDLYLDLAVKSVIKSFDPGDYNLVDVGKPENIAIAESLFK
ncbi:sugar phosphate nucleotidyltransferase [Rhizosphaericola mali]|uniref:NTP transferase domain-containing protein n=1 Tax=Rhizosphaericola mali TaxID=2545455 RepID=A0A5P2G774_9BACT|nr:sugar phosphate nucleotidyltransferase [Rhizosphaericola mali]QES89792.1 NTP transferase domain-containing protein [Rhizosphaericola mali]